MVGGGDGDVVLTVVLSSVCVLPRQAAERDEVAGKLASSAHRRTVARIILAAAVRLK